MSASIATALRAQAAALIAVAEALESQPPAGPPPAAAPANAAASAPAKRGRGRPVAGEPSAAPAASPVAVATQPDAVPVAATTEVDPFAPAAPQAPTPPPATRDEVSAALRALSAATTQENALAVLKKAGGEAANLTDLKPEFYGAVAAAAKGAMSAPTPTPAPVAEADPFEATTPAAAPVVAAVWVPTREEVKAVVVATQKRTSTETVQKILMEHGGKAEDANRVMQPSLRALPEANFVKFIAALNALPATK